MSSPDRAGTPRLLIRADATPATGAGHLMRSLNVAERWGGDHAVDVAGDVSLSFVTERLERLGIGLRTAAGVAGADVLLVDTYDAADRLACATADAALRVLVDDVGEPVPHGYSMVLNPNAYGTRELYPAFSGPVLTGAENVPLRNDLPKWEGGGSGCLGAALGGGLPPPLVSDALAVVARTSRARARIAARPLPGWSAADERAPWQQLGACDAVILAGGTTLWEAAAVGAPCVVIKLADNQRLSARWADAQGVPVIDAMSAASATDLAERIVASLPRARPLPPMHDASRAVARRLQAAWRARQPAAMDLRVRRAGPEDARTLWTWFNDTGTRGASFNPEPVAWPDHVAWLHARLERDDHVILIAELAGRPIASVRFDTRNDWRRARMSIVVAPERRGLGYGGAALQAAVQHLRADHPDVTIVAEVKPDNDPSARMLRKCGWSVDEMSHNPVIFRFPGASRSE